MATINDVRLYKYLFLAAGIYAFVASSVKKKWLDAAEIVPITALLWFLGLWNVSGFTSSVNLMERAGHGFGPATKSLKIQAHTF
jgi:hypothetical protein